MDISALMIIAIMNTITISLRFIQYPAGDIISVQKPPPTVFIIEETGAASSFSEYSMMMRSSPVTILLPMSLYSYPSSARALILTSDKKSDRSRVMDAKPQKFSELLPPRYTGRLITMP